MNPLTSYVFQYVGLTPHTHNHQGAPLGKYLYVNTSNNVQLASWEKPTHHDPGYLYKGEDLGYNTDAMLFDKHEN
jgi:hypothetical protein